MLSRFLNWFLDRSGIKKQVIKLTKDAIAESILSQKRIEEDFIMTTKDAIVRAILSQKPFSCPCCNMVITEEDFQEHALKTHTRHELVRALRH